MGQTRHICHASTHSPGVRLIQCTIHMQSRTFLLLQQFAFPNTVLGINWKIIPFCPIEIQYGGSYASWSQLMHYTSRPYLDGILFFDPVWDKHHLGGCFASSGQIGEESEERQDAKIFGSTGGGRTSFCLNLKGSLSQLLDLKGSLQRSAAKRCFNGPLWSANNLGAAEKSGLVGGCWEV